MAQEALTGYVTERIKQGRAKAELREELFSLGWTDEEIEASYRDAVIALGAPVPTEVHRPALAKKAGAGDVALNFFSFILLGIIATALGTLFFQVINSFFPDTLDATTYYLEQYSTDAIHYATAALLIGFPLYYFSMRLWFRKFREDEGRAESKLSKWLTYIVLLITAVTIVGDLIAILYALLQGEVSARFFLKALIILGIAGSIFGFYYLERRKIQYYIDIPRVVFQRFGAGVSAFVALGIVLGFMVGGTPSAERDRSFDATRAEHLSSLANCVEQYASTFGRLPASLAEFRGSSQYNYCLSSFADPETGNQYEYRVVTASLQEGTVQVGEYELCATFALGAPDSPAATPYVMPGVWYEHEAGRSCDRVKAALGTSGFPEKTY